MGGRGKRRKEVGDIEEELMSICQDTCSLLTDTQAQAL